MQPATLSTIYLLMAYTGEYCDASERVVAAHLSEACALQHRDLAKAAADELMAKSALHRLRTEATPYDALCVIDGYISYHVVPVPLVDGQLMPGQLFEYTPAAALQEARRGGGFEGPVVGLMAEKLGAALSKR